MGSLSGVRVLDLTRLLPGAYATLLLADLGAEVIKIEDPRGGDGMRSLQSQPDGRNPYFERLNRNKRSVTLDLRKAEAAAVLDALATHADVMVDSFRPSTARRLGVDPETIRSRHPHLVCGSISGFGANGPYVERAAHDLNYQALAGLVRPPALPGPLVGDIGAAMQAATRIVAALFERSRSGAGLVDVSDDRRHCQRLLQRVRNRRRPVAGARRSRIEVLEGVLRADRAAGSDPAAAHAGAGARAGRECRTRGVPHADSRRVARA